MFVKSLSNWGKKMSLHQSILPTTDVCTLLLLTNFYHTHMTFSCFLCGNLRSTNQCLNRVIKLQEPFPDRVVSQSSISCHFQDQSLAGVSSFVKALLHWSPASESNSVAACTASQKANACFIKDLGQQKDPQDWLSYFTQGLSSPFQCLVNSTSLWSSQKQYINRCLKIAILLSEKNTVPASIIVYPFDQPLLAPYCDLLEFNW